MIAEKKAPMVAREATYTGALKDDGIPVRHETMVLHSGRKLFAKSFLSDLTL